MKKIVAFVLSLAVILACLPSFALADNPVTVYEDLSAVEGLEEALKNPQKNLAYNSFYSGTKGVAGTVNFSYTNAEKTNESIIEYSSSKIGKLTNGILDESHVDLNATVNNAAAPLFVDSNGNAVDGVWLDITLSFIKSANIEAVLLASVNDQQTHFVTQEYEVYAGNDLSNLYSEANKKYVYTCQNSSRGQYIKFNENVSAQYVGIRITKALIPERVPAEHRIYGIARLREIAVFGEITCSEEDFIESEGRAEKYKAKLKTEAHLNYGYAVTQGKAKSAFFSKGCDEGNELGWGNFKSYTTSNDLADGDVATFSDVSIEAATSHMRHMKDGAFKENTYGEIIVCLNKPSIVDSILIAQRSELMLRSKKYDIYISDEYEDLFDEENRYVQHETKTDGRYQTFSFGEGVKANFVAMRIYEPVTLPQYNLGDDAAYIRLAEFAVFGEENDAKYSYSATSNVGDFINKSGLEPDGTKLSFSAPLTGNGYSFKGWTVNGKAVDGTVDLIDNVASIDMKLCENLNIVAVYEQDSDKLQSSKFKIIGNKVIVDRDTLVYEIRSGFEHYMSAIEVEYEGETASDRFYAESLMNIKLHSAGQVVNTYNLHTIGDANADGNYSVSDVVASVNATLSGGNEETTAICDMDKNGVLTVSDAVILRKEVLNVTEFVDYSEKTAKTSEMEFKKLGRVITEEDGEICFDLPSSGFAFRLNCFGSVSAQVYVPAQKYFTVVIDGVETEVKATSSGTINLPLAKGLSRGEHTFEVYTTSGYSTTLKGITFSGISLDAPKNKDRYIEFLGDSITEGGSNMVDAAGVPLEEGRTRNEYYSFASVAARKLGADWSNFCRGGAYLVARDEATAIHIPSVYAQETIDSKKPYSFERKPDVVVINLGTNDGSTLYNKYSTNDERKAAFKTEAKKLVELVYEKNGEDLAIVFAFGLMTNKNYMDEAYQELAQELTAEGKEAHYVRLPTNKDGGNGHPDVAGATKGGEVLAEFIEENVFK